MRFKSVRNFPLGIKSVRGVAKPHTNKDTKDAVYTSHIVNIAQ